MKKRIYNTLKTASVLLAFATVAQADGLDFGDPDKQLHALAGAGIYTSVQAIGGSDNQALATCAAVAVAKEAYDSTGRGNVELADAIATILPCLLMHAMTGNSDDQPAYNQHVETPVSPEERRDLIAYGNSRRP